MSQIDLNNPPEGHKYSVTIDRDESIAERNLRLARGGIVFLLAVVFVVLIVWVCFSTLTSSNALAEEKKWAMSVLSAATGGIIGYLLKR